MSPRVSPCKKCGNEIRCSFTDEVARKRFICLYCAELGEENEQGDEYERRRKYEGDIKNTYCEVCYGKDIGVYSCDSTNSSLEYVKNGKMYIPKCKRCGCFCMEALILWDKWGSL